MRVIPGLRAYVRNYKLGKRFKMSSAQRSGVLRAFGMTKAGGGLGITAHTSRRPPPQKKIAAMTPRELVAFAAPMILDSRPRGSSGGSNRHAAAIKAWETRRRMR